MIANPSKSQCISPILLNRGRRQIEIVLYGCGVKITI
jgi:hypothetical protein